MIKKTELQQEIFIENAENPCKVAWSVINNNRNKTTAYKCLETHTEQSYFEEIQLVTIHKATSGITDVVSGLHSWAFVVDE